MLFLRLAEIDSAQTLSTIFGVAYGTKSLVLGGIGFPPDPLQLKQNFLAVNVVMGHQCAIYLEEP